LRLAASKCYGAVLWFRIVSLVGEVFPGSGNDGTAREGCDDADQ